MPKKPPKGKSLAEVNPELAKEWHPTKNGNLTPFHISPGTRAKAWWKCLKGDDHEYFADVKNRANGSGCPICNGKKVVPSNSLATLNPKLTEEWHAILNRELTPNDVTPGSKKKVWWKCPKGDDHIWKAGVVDRRKHGCPICQGLKVAESNSLATLYPKLTPEWHPTWNGDLTPHDIVPGSARKVWWKCPKGDDHEFLSSPNNRTKGTGCPICKNQIVVNSNCLATINPQLSLEWHPTKNGDLTPKDVTAKSTLKVWWKCHEAEDHVWQSRVADRYTQGCPACIGRKLSITNSLNSKYPEISSLWHPTKNGKLLPEDIVANSHTTFWWKCPKGEDHEWRAKPNSLIQNSKNGNSNGCPICRGVKAVKSNCLETLYPEITKEWHPTKNGNLNPTKITAFSGKKVWWRCHKDSDHEWMAQIVNRTNRSSKCPYCTLTPQSRQELTITFELKQFFDINPRGFKTRIKGKLWSIDIFIPKLNLGIEFDGSYWHKNKRDLDKLKTNKLEGDGFTIMRIREEPLKPITDIDIVANLPFNPKKVTDNILEHIRKVYSLDDNLGERINEYLKSNEIQNEKGLNKYIDEILKEKVSKNG
jgi:very-short-patch-repair endonuclease